MSAAIVVGAGVSGLSCGVRLLEGGWTVTVVARHPPEATTSAAAGAIWYPYLAFPESRVLEWGSATLRELEGLAFVGQGAGVSMLTVVELHRTLVPDPWWATAVPGFRYAGPDRLRPGFTHGWLFDVPLLRVPVYLAWLRDRLIDLGGRLEILDRDLESLPTDRAPVVVNCAGMGARRLVDDPSLTPVRGQVVVVRNPGLAEGILVETGPDSPIYVLPRGTDCVLGGTADEGDERLDPDPETTEAILDKCAAIEPALSGAELIEVKVGLRPARPAVRVEAEQLPGGVLLIHDYGHGGAGFTLSWGCADEVVRLASAAAEPRVQGAVEQHLQPRVPRDTGGVDEPRVSGTQVGVRPYDPIGDGIWAKALVQRIGGNLQVRRGEAVDVLELPGLVATIAGRPVGIVTYRRDGAECELAVLATEHDGRGVGTALIEALVAAAAGCRRLWVVTTNDNLRALRFYQRRGFRLAQVRPGAVDEARRTHKPQIPLIGADGIPLRDEIELELMLPRVAEP